MKLSSSNDTLVKSEMEKNYILLDFLVKRLLVFVGLL